MPVSRWPVLWQRLSVKLIVSLTVIVILVSSTYAFYHIQTQRKRILDTMVLGADQLSKGITSATWHTMLADQRSAAYEIMQKIAEKQGIDRIRMFNREGRVMFSTRAEEISNLTNRTSEVCAPCHGSAEAKGELNIQARARIVTDISGRPTLTMVTPIYNEPSCSTAACHAHPVQQRVLGVLDVSLLLDPVIQEEQNVRKQVAITIAIQITVIALFLIFFVRLFVVIPINELIAGTKAISELELSSPVEIRHRSLEMDALVESFNTMKGRLRAASEEVNQFTQQLETKVIQRTEQLKVAQQKLMQNDRLASLGQLAASVAHEINNPVAGILNLSMLMQRILKDDGIPKGRESEFRKYLTQVISETGRVGRIVSDLLSFSRRSKPQREPADLNALVQRTLSLVEHRLRLSNLTMDVKLEPDLPLVLCDASQLQQVILNLVLNAAEATAHREDGRIGLSTHFEPSAGVIQMTVEDNGEGIRPENLARIFDPFFTTKPDGKGVGLGLAVLYGIVQAHDGDVEVTSAPGQGSRFVVTLPLDGGHSTHEAAAAAKGLAG
jgi:two-component system NtrC family sensor kinase